MAQNALKLINEKIVTHFNYFIVNVVSDVGYLCSFLNFSSFWTRK